MATTLPTSLASKPTSSNAWWKSKSFKRFRRNPLAVVGALLLTFYILIALFAPQLTVYQLQQFRNNCVRDLGLSRDQITDIRNPLKPVFWRTLIVPPQACFSVPRASFSSVPQPPSETLWMGASSGGYDIYYGLVWGTRSAFYVGVLVVGIGLALGIVVGSIAGYFGGWIDNLFMRFVDIIYALPGLLISIVVVTVLGRSLTNVMLSIAFVGWIGYARILRGDILQIKQREFVDGARALGAKGARVIFRHILPNTLGTLLIVASLDIGAVVLGVAALSFLGLGAEAGYADWGQMINFARNWIKGPPNNPFAYWYVSFYPGLVIFMFVLAWNLLGDAVRDVLDVRS
jgi:peptide/nickel transport system permease protein